MSQGTQVDHSSHRPITLFPTWIITCLPPYPPLTCYILFYPSCDLNLSFLCTFWDTLWATITSHLGHSSRCLPGLQGNLS